MIERHIDYLQMTVPIAEKTLQNDAYEAIAPIKFYKRGYRSTNSVRYYFGNPNSNKCSVLCSGFALMFEREMFKNDAAMLDYWLSRNAKISRIDLAVTDWIDTDFVTVSDVKEWYERGLIESVFCEGGCKIISEVLQDAPQVDETLYLGNIQQRGKKGIFRAYDKGLEIELSAHLATRLEVEFKGDNAHSTASRIASTNDISGNFRAKINVNHHQFERLMDAPVADTSRNTAKPKRELDTKIDDRWNWLLNTVAPSLREAIKHDSATGKGDANLTKFLIRAGISEDIKKHVKLLTDRVLADATEKIDLL